MGSTFYKCGKPVLTATVLMVALGVSAAAAAASVRLGDRGPDVVRLQQALIGKGFLSTRATGYFGNSTMTALKSFQRSKGLTPDGIAGKGTMRSLGVSVTQTATAVAAPATYTVRKGDSLWTIAKRLNARVSDIERINGFTGRTVLDVGQAIKVPPAKSGSVSRGMTATPTGHARIIPWDTVSGIYTEYATITDVRTGLSFRGRRRGGSEHADTEPVTAEDTAVLKSIYGGRWSWDRRAVIVTVGGMRIAGSMNGMPHGGDEIQGNDFEGHICVHFLGSRTHGSRNVDPDHQAMIRLAARY